jgi:hypothetical protein
MLFSLSGRDIVTEEGREAVGRGHRKQEAPRSSFRRLGAGWSALDRGRVSDSRHLSCESCRVRLRASAPEVDLLDGMCPLCGEPLRPAARVADVLGFGLFDVGLGLPSDHESRSRSGAQRSSDKGGSVRGEW